MDTELWATLMKTTPKVTWYYWVQICPTLGLERPLRMKVLNLLENSARGIAFEATQELVQAIKTLIEKEGLDRILQLFFALNQLAQSNYTLITPNTFHTIASKKSELRINEVCLFIQNNFNSNITLKQVASQIYLTESNFCKFFKKATGKTFSDYLNEIRINEASRLLLQTDKTISQISFECGFETLSYFNRVFLKKKNQTPSGFRNNNNK